MKVTTLLLTIFAASAAATAVPPPAPVNAIAVKARHNGEDDGDDMAEMPGMVNGTMTTGSSTTSTNSGSGTSGAGSLQPGSSAVFVLAGVLGFAATI
jgi:hypothetical protein